MRVVSTPGSLTRGSGWWTGGGPERLAAWQAADEWVDVVAVAVVPGVDVLDELHAVLRAIHVVGLPGHPAREVKGGAVTPHVGLTSSSSS